MYEYYACSGCKREFFSEAEFKAHECMATRKDTSGNLSRLATSEKLPKFDTKPGVTSAPVKKKAENTTQSEEMMTIDKTLDECKELVDMKTELVANGVQCQTMNEEQTRAAYAKLKEEEAKKKDSADDGNVPPPPPPASTATSAKRARTKKTETADK